jgi:hypothetical protein
LITAFSREGPSKVYVQHRLQEHAQEVNELLQQKAYFYVCGDAANMAREVNTVLAKIMAEQRGIPEAKAEEIVKSMRSSNQYQVHHSLVPEIPASYISNTDPNPLTGRRLVIADQKGGLGVMEVDSWDIGSALQRPLTFSCSHFSCMPPPCERRRWRSLAHKCHVSHAAWSRVLRNDRGFAFICPCCKDRFWYTDRYIDLVFLMNKRLTINILWALTLN